ncbi:MAG TPA: hypothetical protein VM222_08395, partial [Planctomycetota bacterium]|nr:hypothetical protein [Planctomycetota bacterium]
ISDAPELRNFVAKLRPMPPAPVEGSLWNVTVNLNHQTSVSLELLASTNEAGWHVQSYFSAPLK